MDVAFQLLALTTIEIVLGVDNLIINSVLAEQLPVNDQAKARRIGLIAAMALRLALLFAVGWIMGLGGTLFSIGRMGFSGKDLLLIGGGGFLLYQSGTALLAMQSGSVKGDIDTLPKPATWSRVMTQMMAMNLVFSLDAIITAIGVTDHVWVMVTAIVASAAVMLLAAEPIIRLVVSYPSVKMVALSALLMIGTILVLEGFSIGVPKWIIYLLLGALVGYAIYDVRTRKRAIAPAP